MRSLQTELVEKGVSRLRTDEVDRKSIRARGKQSEKKTDRELAE